MDKKRINTSNLREMSDSYTIKYRLFLTIVLLSSFAIQAQEENSKQSQWSFQAGVMGIWLNNEIRLSEKFALRNEAGVEMINWSISHKFLTYGDKEPIIPLVLTTEPRFYFAGQNAKVSWFLSLKTSYHPPVSLFSSNQHSDISVVPIIAVRTKFGKRFIVEAGGGIGYQYNLSTFDTGSDWAFNIVLKVGYMF
jgi:hypothetical protein